MNLPTQIQTERGLIYVEAEYDSVKQAIIDGYTYMFTSSELGKDVYSKVQENCNSRSFALVTGKIMLI